MCNRTYRILHARDCDVAAAPRIFAGRLSRVLAGSLMFAVSVLHALPARADITVNVDDRAAASFSEMVVGQTVKTYTTQARVTNTSASEILPPLRLVIFDIEKKNTTVSNADGFTSGGLPFIEIDLARDALAPGEASPPAAVEFFRPAGESPPGSRGNGKAKHANFPTFDFSHSVQGGSSVSLSAPSSTPFALVPGSGPTDVDFSVSAVTETGDYDGDVFLQGPDLGAGVEMTDSDGDGIFSAMLVVATDALAGGDCLSYTASTTAPGGAEIESPVYRLCATGYPIDIGESNTAPGNQVVVDGGTAVADELLIFVEPGTSESVIASIERQFDGEVIGTLLPHGMYQFLLGEALSADELQRLAAAVERVDGVVGAGPNFIGSYTSVPNDPAFPLQHGMQLVSADSLAATPKFVWDANATGGGTTVLVLDSGIDASHPDLTVLPENSPGDNIDALGHGTEMAGVIRADTDNLAGVAAMARDTQLRSIKISADNSVTEAEMLSGLTTALPLAGPNVVVNTSFSIFGLLLPTVNMCSAIDDLINAGSVVVNSAGNDNTSTTGVWPGMCNDSALNGLLGANIIADENKPSFIVVAASNCSSGACTTDTRKADSNFGAWVDIAAPGVNVRTTTLSGTYTDSNGTSAAAALTSGGATLLRSCGVASTDVFDRLDLGATVAVTADFNRVNIYNSLNTLNTSPTGIGLSSSVIDENVDTSGGSLIGNLSTADSTACDAHRYAVTGGADAASFSINGDQLLLDDGTLDFETKSSYSVQVTSTDFYGASTSQTVTVNVNDLPETTELVSCGTDNTGGDLISRGFFHPSYPGTTVDQVELFISARQAGAHTVRLDVRTGAYDGTLIASDTQTETLTANDEANVSYVFDLGDVPVVSGSVVTFSMALTAGPLSPLSDNEVFYAVDAAEHPLGIVDPTPSCDIDETEGTTPPLDTFRRDGVWVRIDGSP